MSKEIEDFRKNGEFCPFRSGILSCNECDLCEICRNQNFDKCQKIDSENNNIKLPVICDEDFQKIIDFESNNNDETFNKADYFGVKIAFKV
jgi:hypothetical protein